MANKFLGLDSINVLKQYIDEQILNVNNDSRIVTIQAYSYWANGSRPDTPANTSGLFDPDSVTVQYPEGWYSLKVVLEGIGDVEEALGEGSIWMSAGVAQGDSEVVWSTPMKISGQNGVSVRFAYSYDEHAAEADRTPRPLGVNAANRVEYVWTQSGEDPWQGPTIWAMYAQDASDLYWRYCTTATADIPLKPTSDTDSNWSNSISTSITVDKPYMWMSWRRVPAGNATPGPDAAWHEPILFGHYGKDGEVGKDGVDGSVPDYTQTLYHKGSSNPEISDVPGIIAPQKPAFIADATITDYIKDGWVELPTEPEVEEGEEPVADPTIWWQCTFKVDGKTDTVLSEDSIGAVKRYSAIDGNAKAGQFTMNLYAWSETQEQPEMSDELVGEWRPKNYEYLPDRPMDLTAPEASLWMITANVAGLDADGKPIVNGSWSEPVKLTGPRGPISYDYRIESRYNWGTSVEPISSPTEDIWYTLEELNEHKNSDYPYVWATNYLMCYKMKYDTTATPDAAGEYPVVTDGDGEIINQTEAPTPFRLSGLNGENGNRKNNVVFNSATTTITSFAATNYFITNLPDDVTYTINIDQLSFINGYTGKFSNIGKGTMTLKADAKYKFIGSTTEAMEIVLNPQETVELVCYNVGNEKVFLVIGKELGE